MERSLSLQGRLAMLVVAAILPLAALSVWFAVNATQEATSEAQAQLKFSASLTAWWSRPSSYSGPLPPCPGCAAASCSAA